MRPQAPDDPPPFYVMRTKASNDLVAALRVAAGGPPWRFDAGKGSLPTLGLTAAEARALAEELARPVCRRSVSGTGRPDFFNRQGRDGPTPGPHVAVGRIDKARGRWTTRPTTT